MGARTASTGAARMAPASWGFGRFGLVGDRRFGLVTEELARGPKNTMQEAMKTGNGNSGNGNGQTVSDPQHRLAYCDYCLSC